MGDQERLQFFANLRNDAKVRSLGVEKDIRNLVDLLEDYHRYANTANSIHIRLLNRCHNREDRALIGLVEDIGRDMFMLTQTGRSYFPIELDFSDVADIAYFVCCDESSWLQRLKEGGALKKRFRTFQSEYDRITQIGEIRYSVFPPLIIDKLITAADPSADPELRRYSLAGLIRKAVNHLNREGNLHRLYHSRRLIEWYYYGNGFYTVDGDIAQEDLQVLGSLMREEIMSKKDIQRAALLFGKQADICSYMFKCLYSTSLKLMGEQKTREITESQHQYLMDQFKRDGVILR